MTDSPIANDDGPSVEARLATAIRREAALGGVLRAVAEAGGDLEHVLFDIAFHATELMGGAHAVVFVVEGDRIAVYNFVVGPAGEPVRTKSFRDHSDVSALTEVLRDRKVLRFDDQSTLGDNYSQSREAAIRMGTKSTVYVPLPSTGPPLGIYVARREIDTFTDADVELLQSFAVQAGNAVTAAKQRSEIDRRNAELAGALKLQTATSEVLRLISAHPGDLPTVLAGVMERAVALCDAENAVINQIQGTDVEVIASHGYPNDIIGMSFGGMTRERVIDVRDRAAPLFIEDWQAIPADRLPAWYAELNEASGVRSTVMVQLRHEESVFGYIEVGRFQVRPFNDHNARVLQTFAEQAMIAITNAKLFNDLDAALEQQTATSEVLALISAHPGELRTVLEGILEKAAALCGADAGATMLRIAGADADADATPRVDAQGDAIGDDGLRVAATFGDRIRPLLGREFRILNASRMARDLRQPVLVDDMADDMAGFPTFAEFDIRSFVSVSLFDGSEWIGNLNLYRQEVRPFDPQQAAVLQAFAHQAAIAIANAKLFNDLDTALEHQTASADIMRVISSSPGDLDAALPEIGNAAKRLCEADHVAIFFLDGSNWRNWDHVRGMRVGVDSSPDRSGPAGTVISTVWETGAPLRFSGNIERLAEEYPVNADIARSDGLTEVALLTVPLPGRVGPVGAIIVRRNSARPFDDSHVALLRGFADQVVIAIDNARLFNALEERNSELGESLELQTATSEVLALISASPGDLDAVFNGIVSQAARLCDADGSGILRFEGSEMVLVATSIAENRSLVGLRFAIPPEIDRRQTRYHDDISVVRPDDAAQRMRPVRSYVSVPLVVDDAVFGSINVNRHEMRPFEPRHGRILQAFAEQAAIAIGNARRRVPRSCGSSAHRQATSSGRCPRSPARRSGCRTPSMWSSRTGRAISVSCGARAMAFGLLQRTGH